MIDDRKYNISIVSDSDPDRDVLLSKLQAFNASKGVAPAVPFLIKIHASNKELIAGIAGRSLADWMLLELLWVDTVYRGCGLGQKLLKLAEREAKQRKCIGMLLDTFDFQAPLLYPKLGYQCLYTVDDHPSGHKRLFFQKVFPAAGGRARVDSSN